MRRRELFAIGAAAALWPLSLRAQQKAEPVIGLLHSLAEARTMLQIDAFRDGLRDSGYIEGRNLAIEYRWADGDYYRLPELAAELVRGKVDVIGTGGTKSALAAKAATSTIPIVLCLAADPTRTGLVASLAKPGGNITGVGLLSLDLLAKRIKLLSELVPRARAIALMVNPNVMTWESQVDDARQATSRKGLQLEVLKAGSKRADEVIE
jgi:putative ABC transport system substrate-binding protein